MRRVRRTTGMVCVVAFAAAGLDCSTGATTSTPSTRPAVVPQTAVALAGASALAALPGGGFLGAERATGSIREVTPAGSVRPDPVVTVAVSSTGTQGLLGLAVDGSGRVFAVWTAPPGASPEAGRLVVGQVFPGPARFVWIGPPSGDHNLGGHLVLAADGRLVVGIGDLGDGARVADPIAANGKLLSLDPDGQPAQAPIVISSGWRNPTGFAFTPDGRLWVVDKSSASGGRLARGDSGGRPADAATLTGTAVGGVAAISTEQLVVCIGSGDGRLERRLVARTGRPARSRPNRELAGGCTLGVTRLVDGRVAAAGPDKVRLLALT